MSKKTWLSIGDRVRVEWERCTCLEGVLVDTDRPEEATMEEYSIRDDQGKIHQVMHYCRMSQI